MKTIFIFLKIFGKKIGFRVLYIPSSLGKGAEPQSGLKGLLELGPYGDGPGKVKLQTEEYNHSLQPPLLTSSVRDLT